MVEFRCPNCNERVNLLDAGTPDFDSKMTCPSCRSEFTLTLDETKTFTGAVQFTLGNFEVESLLGEGAFGAVYKARDTQLDRIVAIKRPRETRLSPEQAKLFLREAQAAAQVQHPNIVRVHEIGQHEGEYYIVSEYVEGITLAEWLRHNEPTPPAAAKLAVQICRAVQAAHDGKVIHRDLKPGNILMDEEGEPHITDFGLARRERAADMTITQSGRVIGTPLYMSPEQARGDTHNTTHLSDIYSVGVILYELLTGTPPFRATNSNTLLHRIKTEEPKSPRRVKPTIDRDLATICLKSLEKEPAQRYASALELGDDLQRFLRGEPIHARPTGQPERLWRLAKRHPLVSGLSATLVLVVAVLFTVIVRQPQPPPVTSRTAHPVSISVMLKGGNVPSGKVVDWAFVRLDPVTRLPREETVVRQSGGSLAELSLEPGEYLVVVRVNGVGFHEVYRYVPEDPLAASGSFNHTRWQVNNETQVELPPIVVRHTAECTVGMSLIQEGNFMMGDSLDGISSAHNRTVETYYLDRLEVTTAEIVEAGFTASTDTSIPATHPIINVTWQSAVAYAEFVGKRLMTEAEYEFAAKNRGTTKFPWGNDPALIENWTSSSPVGTPEYDVTQLQVRGLLSNVAEWTDSVRLPYPGGKPIFEQLVAENSASRAVRGGPSERGDAKLREQQQAAWSVGVAKRTSLHANSKATHLGFRCARSYRARYLSKKANNSTSK